MRKMLGSDKIRTLLDFVGFDVFSRLLANRHLCAALDNGAYLVAFHFCDIRKPLQKDERVCIYCNIDTLIFVCDNKHCLALMGDIDEKIEPYKQLLQFMSTLTANDVTELEKTEDLIADLEDRLITEKRSNSDNSDSIIHMRRQLLKIKRYYEQLALITEDFTENANKAFSDDLLKRYVSLDKRMDYLLGSVLHLREYITQVREAYQAQVDIEQNQIMKVFTVITAVFLPLTLIVGWYGMNFDMPEYRWNLGYGFVIVLSIVVCIGCMVIFKRKKWY